MHGNDTISHGSPYEGKTLVLSVTEGVPPKKHTIDIQISRLIQPSTLSCVMDVDVLATSGSTKYAKHSILKLYDWRYATQLRRDFRVDQWTPYHEDIYRAFVADGGAAKFISAMENDTDDPARDLARNETLLFDICRDFHSCEVEAYSRLEDLQGRSVPRFYADVRLDAFPIANALFEVRGILLERVVGYSLADLATHAPPSCWQRLCEETIRTVDLIGDHGILNEDVKPRNVLIRTHGDVSGNEVVIIDFAQCSFRETDQSEADWQHEKWRQDEAGAIGYVMAHDLNGAFEYRPSDHFYCSCVKCREV